MRYPQIRPQTRPTMVAIGIDVAGCPSDTPPTNTTASIPSRKTVMRGKKKRTHFPVRVPLSVSNGVRYQCQV